MKWSVADTIVIAVVIVAMIVAAGATWVRVSGTHEGISQECFVAIQLRLAETPAEDRAQIPDAELNRVCPGWERFEVPTTTP